MPVPFLNSITLNRNQVQDFSVSNLNADPNNLAADGDIGYFWTNTAAKRLRWWDGTSVRSIHDTSTSITGTQISGNISGKSAGLTGGGNGTLVWQSAESTTNFLNIGTAGSVLTVNTNATGPQWVAQSTLSVGTAALAATASKVANPLKAGSFITSTGDYDGSTIRTFAVNASSEDSTDTIVSRNNNGDFTARNITAELFLGKATTASAIFGGGPGRLVYQTNTSNTGFVFAGNAGQILIWNGTENVPVWGSPSTLSVGSANTAERVLGGDSGTILYQSQTNYTQFLPIGTAGQVLLVNAGETAPTWTDQSQLNVGSAVSATVSTKLAGGSLGSIPVQTGTGNTGFLSIGTAGNIITSSGTSPQWSAPSTITVGKATSLATGSAGSIPYQTAAGETTHLSIGANFSLLASDGSAPLWKAPVDITVGRTVNIALGSAGNLVYQTDASTTGFVSNGAKGTLLSSNAPSAPVWVARNSIFLDSFGPPFGNLPIGGKRIIAVANPVDPSDAATKQYVDENSQGLSVKTAAVAATTTALPSYVPTFTVGVAGASLEASANGTFPTAFDYNTTPAVGQRVLVKNETALLEKFNGIYTITSLGSASSKWSLTRAADFDQGTADSGSFVFIQQGSTLAGSGWVMAVSGVVINQTAVTWSQFSGSTSYQPGNGIVLSNAKFHFAKETDYTANSIPFANGATTISFIAPGTSAQVLQANATGVPSFVSISGDATINNGGELTIGAGKVLFGKLQQVDALGVVGNATNSADYAASITAGTDHQVLRRSGTSIGFGALNLAQTAATTGILPPSRGGTGSQFFSVSGLDAERTITFPNRNCRVASIVYGNITGDGISKTFDFNHSFGTRNVIVQVFNSESPYNVVYTDIEANTLNSVLIKFATAPVADKVYVVIVTG